MVAHTCGLLRGRQVAPSRLEELHDRRILERRRVGDVHNYLGARKRLGQALARNGVDARVGRGREHFLAPLTKHTHELRSDQPRATNDYDFHMITPVEGYQGVILPNIQPVMLGESGGGG